MIYLDYCATTPPTKEILDFADYLQRHYWQNPNSIHKQGREVRNCINRARNQCAEAIGADSAQIFFTSCASESNAMVISHAYYNYDDDHIRNSPYEHTDIIENPLSTNLANKAALEYAAEIEEGLLSIMLVNNESGRIFDVGKYAKMVHNPKYKHPYWKGRKFHSDMSQAFGKVPINVRELDVDFATFSSQKIGSIRGCSVLYVKDVEEFTKGFDPLIVGHQEHKMRGGTENTVAIACMGMAMEKYNYDPEVDMKLAKYKQNMIEELSKIKGFHIINQDNGDDRFTNNILQIGFDGVNSQSLVLVCDSYGLCISGGAACNSHSGEPSNEVKYLCGLQKGIDPRNIVRVSYGRETTGDDIFGAIRIIRKAVRDLRDVRAIEI